MDPTMRKRYEVVRVQDLLDFYAEINVNPECYMCKGTFFTIETIDNERGASESFHDSEPDLKKQMVVCEMHGTHKTWQFYPLSCVTCGTFLNVDAAKLLKWTEEKRLKDAGEGVSVGNGSESNA